jgi:hypothetical protein
MMFERLRIKLAKALLPKGCAVVPQEPTKLMIKAACASMSPGKRPTPEWVSNPEKHKIRYRAMIKASRL